MSKFGKMLVRAGLAAALPVLLPATALAHGGHAVSFAAAFAHPFGGLDHLLAMLVVGVWGARIAATDGRGGLAVPAAFVTAAAAGLLAGQAGLQWVATETAVAASLIVIGSMLAFALRVPVALAAAVCALAGFLHGLAHGAELTEAGAAAVAGLICATALLHALGFGSLLVAATRARLLARLFGAGVGVAGIVLAAQLA